MVDETNNHPVFCPRCDRKYDSQKSKEASMKLLKDHIDKGAHPDQDLSWFFEEDPKES